jgi:hypothetical protein
MVKERMDCSRVQEELAWGRELSEPAQWHVVECALCGQVALEYTELDSKLSRHLSEAPVPEGFAARVMERLPVAASGNKSPGRAAAPAGWTWLRIGLASAWLMLASLAFAPSAGGADREARTVSDPSWAVSRASG